MLLLAVVEPFFAALSDVAFLLPIAASLTSHDFPDRWLQPKAILDAVLNDNFFGLLEVDLITPPDLRKEFNKINFGLIFDKLTTTKEMLGDRMRKLAESYNYKFSLHPQLTVLYETKNYLITSTMLKFYMQLGVQVPAVYYCIEYQRSRPLKKFIDIS